MRSLLLLVALTLAGCAQTRVGPATNLAQARARWEASGADTYTMTLHRSCFCPEDYRGPFDVRVEDDAVASVQFQDQALPTDRVVTIDALFELLAEAYASGAARVDVTYDPELGFPATLYIDRNEMIADEEVGYTVTDVMLR
ncbi:DUF6174 domain-containing protein [Rubricoccus marinus]|uniref:Lipoprotein n=1 Tax=Rubricoccus marinus TaxID=716817 RepID=A0A259TWG4_9BACT|nr:DUF6174 domain-containing protein [Rubricoccus marinus]OZC02061.1 hypothetical protein BSZ36_03120 [Rubricoccus marinus]